MKKFINAKEDIVKELLEGFELLIIYRECAKRLEELGIRIVAHLLGELLTTQEQSGFQLNFAKWDDETLALWNTHAITPAFRK